MKKLDSKKQKQIIIIAAVAVVLILTLTLSLVFGLQKNPEKFELSFTVDGEVQEEVKAGDWVDGTSDSLVKDGYSFGGWYTDDSFDSEWDKNIENLTGDTTLYGKWEAISYSISYVLDGGTNASGNPTSYTVESDKITLLNPTKTGYTFAGWEEGDTIASGSTGDKTFTATWNINTYTITFVNESAETVGTATYTVEDTSITAPSVPTKAGYTVTWASYTIDASAPSSFTVEAIYTADTYTISYELDGGTNAESNVTSYTTESADILLADPTKTGYTFAGWKEGNTITTGSTGNKTFTATWTEDDYTISYVLGGGTNATGNPYSYNIESDTITLQDPTRVGYTFAGWEEGSTITTGSTGNKTFTATWNIVTYTITFIDEDEETVDTATYTVENTSVANPSVPTKTGYTVTWASYTIDTTAPTNFDVKAVYTANSYSIIFDSNGGTGTMSNLSCTYDTETALTANAFTQTGYVFSGWATSTSGSVVYDDEETIENLATSGTYTLYAVWVKTYTITYVLNGGSNSTDNLETYTVNDTISLTNATTTETDYTFGGWYTDESCTKYFTDTALTANIALYALWVMDLSYTDNTTYYSVAGIGNVSSSAIVIPSIYFGLPVTTIEAYAFKDNTTITSVDIADSVNTIGQHAFYGCASLTSISISEYITSFGGYSFQYCTSLTEVYYNASTNNSYTTSTAPFRYSGSSNGCVLVIGSNVTTINQRLFYDFDNLTSVTIDNSVTTIDYYAFSSCDKLTTVYYGGSVIEWSQITIASETANPMYYASDFYANGDKETEVTTIEITGVDTINAYAFYGFVNLTSVTIGEGVTTIGNYAFYGCSGITSLTLGNSVTTISNYAFYGCSGIASLTLGDSVETLSESAFYNCTGLTSVVIGDSLETIGARAFSGCSGIIDITISDSVTKIEDYAFATCTSVKNIYYSGTILEWNQIEFTTGSSNPANEISTTTYLYLNGGTTDVATEISISGVDAINNYAFYGMEGITSVTIGEGVTTIGNHAFYACYGLTNVTIGDSVETIGESAFRSCIKLVSIVIPYNVISLSLNVFYGCASLASITFADTSIWYYTSSSDYTGGTEIDVTVVSTNATNLKSTYRQYYWYKVEAYTITYVLNDGTNAESNPTYYLADNEEITLADPTRTGYTFTGWEEGDTIQSGSTGDLTFTATWKVVTYTITFIDEADATVGTATYTVANTSVTNPSVPTKTGYTVTWASYTIDTTAPTSFTVKAVYTINTYTITFIDEDEETVDTATYTVTNTSVANPSVPTKTGYTVTWASYTIDTTAPTNFDVKAVYTAIDYTITYVLNGGSNSTDNSETYTANDTISLANATTDETDYTFGGWYTDEACTKYFDATSIDDDITLYALWVMDLSYGKYTGYSSVKGIGNVSSSAIVIPSIYFGVPVTTIEAYAFRNNTTITSVVIPDSVKTINNYAFYDCTNLEDVYYSGSTLDWSQINFNSTSANPMYYASDFYANGDTESAVTALDITGVTSINNYAFYGFVNITSVTIDNSVTKINGYSFYGCTSLTSVTIGTSVTSIGLSAFYACSSMANIYYSGTASDWSQITFGNLWSNPAYASTTDVNMYFEEEDATPTTEINISGVSTINAFAFCKANGIKSVVFEDGVTTIGKYSFYGCTSLTSVTIEKSVTTIGSSAFSSCTAVANVYYNGTASDWSQITFVDNGATPASTTLNTVYIYFNGQTTSYATEIEISGVETIKSYAFYGLEGITSITVGAGVTTIEDNYAFGYCKDLVSLIIGDSVKTLGSYMCYSCDALKNVTIGTGVESIGTYAFSHANAVANLYYGGTALDWNEIAFSGSASNPASSTTSTKIYLNGATTEATTEISISGVEAINNYAFYGFAGIESVIIGDSVETIGTSAFCYCTGITSVTIGEGVTTIGNYAFYYCSGITSLTLGNSVTTIGIYAFSGCSNLTSVTFSDSDTSTWYYTSSSDYTGGTEIVVTDVSTNATNLTSTYKNMYWYKEDATN